MPNDYNIGGYLEWRKKKYGETTPKKVEQPTSVSPLGLFGAMAGLLQPQIDYVKNVVLPILDAPGKQFNEGIGQMDKNPIAATLKVAQSLGSLVSAPFTTVDQTLRHIGMEHTANTIASISSVASLKTRWVTLPELLLLGYVLLDLPIRGITYPRRCGCRLA